MSNCNECEYKRLQDNDLYSDGTTFCYMHEKQKLNCSNFEPSKETQKAIFILKKTLKGATNG